ncbi:MAG: sigma-54-dependent Fis family transcriptional regulator [Spirochaetales bacterium]|nr:MAG: sigma-54-dependent Fis family transcriptional regulator [Spirochaetales bacterium]
MSKHPHFPILIVDDQEAILHTFGFLLKSRGMNNVLTAQDSRKVLSVLRETPVSLVLLDLTMPHISGQQLLCDIRREYPDMPVIIVTGNVEIDTAVACMKDGAFDYLVKPVEDTKLVGVITRALQILELRRENTAIREHFFSGAVENPENFRSIITRSEKMKAVMMYVEVIAKTSMPVLISGETGTGKELFARAVHDCSGRSGEYVTVNVAGYDETMFSDSIFGHRKGAFTGADGTRRGLIEKASEGSLFLDEIGDISPQMQVKLLRLAEENEYYPLGSDTSKKSLARLIIATNQDLKAAVSSGSFRKDLYYRFYTHHIIIPPLRERPEDIPLLLEHFVGQAAAVFGKEVPVIPPELFRLLESCSFPGNVRELKALVFEAVSRNPEGGISLEIFRNLSGVRMPEEGIGSSHGLLSFPHELPSLKEAADQLVEEAMLRAGGNQSLAAKLIGISQQALSKRLQNLN